MDQVTRNKVIKLIENAFFEGLKVGFNAIQSVHEQNLRDSAVVQQNIINRLATEFPEEKKESKEKGAK